MSSLQPNPLQEGLKLMNQCPLCKKQYAPDDSSVLKTKQGTHLIHITCPYCRNAVLAMVVVTKVGLSSIGMVTDLNAADVLRLNNLPSLDEEELLHFHSFIKENNLFKVLK